MSHTEAPQPESSWPFLVRILGQSFAVVWAAFWLLAVLRRVLGNQALDAYCRGISGCRAGYTGVALLGLLSGAAVIVVCRRTRRRTKSRPVLHALAPWLLLVLAVCLTIGGVSVFGGVLS